MEVVVIVITVGQCTYPTVCYYHVTYASQSESTLYSCLNVKESLAPNRHDTWSLSDSKSTQTHNHLVHKQTFKHVPKLVKWFSCVVSTCAYVAFDWMLLWCHVQFQSESTLCSIVAWMSRKSSLETSAISEVSVTATRLKPTTT